MHGRIGADSRLGEGSTFWVEVPLQRGAHDTAAAVRPALAGAQGQARLRGARILVVEDNPINQEVTSSLLVSLGATAQVAGSGEEALSVFDAAAHDLILMDVQMPGMDGLRATTAIRQRPGGARVPIIAMTANAFAEDRAQCLAAGMNDYLAKPVEPQALERCLLRWLAEPAPAPGAAPPAPAPADADAELRRRLESIDSLDTVGPLSRMRGAWGLYLRTLRMFVAHHAQDAERLAAIGSTDIPALRALAHSIGGAASTVGATEVMREVQALQGRVAAAPGSVVPPAAGAAAPAGAAADAAAAVLAELRPLLTAHDTAALALFERSRDPLLAAYGDAAERMGQALRRFDFAAAEAALAALPDADRA
jgi:CheY-like chemotaxis protein